MTPAPAGAGAVPASPAFAERLLFDAAQRLARQPEGRLALVLHLSRLRPPAPRPHHRRIARAMLHDTAERHDGQVFALRNGDVVLLARGFRSVAFAPAEDGAGAVLATGLASPGGFAPAEPLALPGVLARLLAADTREPGQLVSLWPLERAHDRLVDYAVARLADDIAPAAGEDEALDQTAHIDTIGDLVNSVPIGDLLQRQTAVLLARSVGALRPDARPEGGIRPLFREVTVSLAALETRLAAPGAIPADPWLLRHLATRLDRRVLAVLAAEIGSHRPLDPALGRQADSPAPMLHVNLTVEGIMSDGFARLAEACRRVGATLGVEVSPVEACADPAGFAHARAIVAAAGMTLALDGLSHIALRIARPWMLRPDLIKLDWSGEIADLAATERAALTAALAEIGPDRIVLHRADSEAAVRWGLRQGIRRFQGAYVDAMLAAARMVACPSGGACALRQCIERAAGAGPGTRRFCAQPHWLDAGVPARHGPATAMVKTGA